ncbi:hypothetical protein B0H13DRAFT_1918049 [Mycena leptocephala]|nr:hypothetical protein B0H13DRAFT_1918049 [Mycena leptocephala]
MPKKSLHGFDSALSYSSTSSSAMPSLLPSHLPPAILATRLTTSRSGTGICGRADVRAGASTDDHGRVMFASLLPNRVREGRGEVDIKWTAHARIFCRSLAQGVWKETHQYRVLSILHTASGVLHPPSATPHLLSYAVRPTLPAPPSRDERYATDVSEVTHAASSPPSLILRATLPRYAAQKAGGWIARGCGCLPGVGVMLRERGSCVVPLRVLVLHATLRSASSRETQLGMWMDSAGAGAGAGAGCAALETQLVRRRETNVDGIRAGWAAWTRIYTPRYAGCRERRSSGRGPSNQCGWARVRVAHRLRMLAPFARGTPGREGEREGKGGGRCTKLRVVGISHSLANRRFALLSLLSQAHWQRTLQLPAPLPTRTHHFPHPFAPLSNPPHPVEAQFAYALLPHRGVVWCRADRACEARAERGEGEAAGMKSSACSPSPVYSSPASSLQPYIPASRPASCTLRFLDVVTSGRADGGEGRQRRWGKEGERRGGRGRGSGAEEVKAERGGQADQEVRARARVGEAMERAQAPAPDVLRLPPPPHPSAAYGARPSPIYAPHLELAVCGPAPPPKTDSPLIVLGYGREGNSARRRCGWMTDNINGSSASGYASAEDLRRGRGGDDAHTRRVHRTLVGIGRMDPSTHARRDCAPACVFSSKRNWMGGTRDSVITTLHPAATSGVHPASTIVRSCGLRSVPALAPPNMYSPPTGAGTGSAHRTLESAARTLTRNTFAFTPPPKKKKNVKKYALRARKCRLGRGRLWDRRDGRKRIQRGRVWVGTGGDRWAGCLVRGREEECAHPPPGGEARISARESSVSVRGARTRWGRRHALRAHRALVGAGRTDPATNAPRSSTPPKTYSPPTARGAHRTLIWDPGSGTGGHRTRGTSETGVDRGGVRRREVRKGGEGYSGLWACGIRQGRSEKCVFPACELSSVWEDAPRAACASSWARYSLFQPSLLCYSHSSPFAFPASRVVRMHTRTHAPSTSRSVNGGGRWLQTPPRCVDANWDWDHAPSAENGIGIGSGGRAVFFSLFVDPHDAADRRVGGGGYGGARQHAISFAGRGLAFTLLHVRLPARPSRPTEARTRTHMHIPSTSEQWAAPMPTCKPVVGAPGWRCKLGLRIFSSERN